MSKQQSLQSRRSAQLSSVQKEALQIFEEKSLEYGKTFRQYGPVGILMHISDKLEQMQRLTTKGVELFNDEGLRDILIDLHNYAAMTIVIIDDAREPPTPPPATSTPKSAWVAVGDQNI